ncbi:hypothetical protein GCM10028805_52270 [Spirosoma harenae]
MIENVGQKINQSRQTDLGRFFTQVIKPVAAHQTPQVLQGQKAEQVAHESWARNSLGRGIATGGAFAAK